MVGVHGDIAIAVNGFDAVLGDQQAGIITNGRDVIELYPPLAGVQNMQLHVFLGMHVDELFPHLVFETEFVKPFALMGLRFNASTGFMLGKWVR